MPRTLLAVVVALGVLVAVTTSLTSYYRAVRDERAQALFARGARLAAEGRADQAVEQLRAAIELARDRHDYELTLASALVELERPGEAATYLGSVLRAEPTNGRANLLRARIARERGNREVAVEFYERAVHGVWPASETTQRQSVRFEFIEFLLDGGVREQALAEMIDLRRTLDDFRPPHQRLARLFVRAGALDQALAEYQWLTNGDPRDADAWAGLADVQMARQAYAAARMAGLRAVALNPADADTRARVALATHVLALDPTLRRLSARERDARSRRLLQATLAALDACVPPSAHAAGGDGTRARGAPAGGPGQPTPAPQTGAAEGGIATLEALRARARTLADAPGRRTASADVVEERLALAEQVWDARIARCPEPAPAEEALAAVMRRIARGTTS